MNKVLVYGALALFVPLVNMIRALLRPSVIPRRPISIPVSVRKVHVVVLVHGWMGDSSEMSYMQESLERQVASQQTESSMFYVYSASANNGRTSDGIEAGGKRLAQEIDAILGNAEGDRSITLSIVGNSMGGLFARYALGELDLGSNVHLKAFYTTATPHLGVGGHTYLPLPRAAEYAVASSMQQSGRDLFRFTDTIERMTTDERFVEPLSRFERRVAFANAYYTDFQVPVTTAAFLGETVSPHYPVHVPLRPPFFVQSFKTPQRALDKATSSPLSSGDMAQRLDALGWTKIFCDMRSTLLSVPVPFSNERKLPEKESYTSAELLEFYGGIPERMHIPFGHTMLIANAKSEVYRRLNAGGKPAVDELVQQLVSDVLREYSE